MKRKKTVEKSFELLDTLIGFVTMEPMLSRLLMVIFMCIIGGGAFAQEKGGRVQEPPRIGRVIDLSKYGALKVEPRVYRPDVKFSEASRALEFEGIPLEWDGLKEVEKSVFKPPF